MSRVVAAGFVLLPALLAGVAGCGPGKQDVSWTIRFETPTLSARAVRVLATVHDGADCFGAVRYAESVPNGTTTMTAPASLRQGQYTVCADAIDDACAIFASGSVTVELRGQVRHVDVLIVAVASAPACPGASCDHGECATADGAIADAEAGAPDADATMDVDGGTDFGVDMGFDMGCGPYVVPALSAPACDSGTLSCLDSCLGDPTCEDSCIASDSNPTACNTCLYDSYDACAVANGCQGVADAFFCCVPGCGDPTSPACCPPEQTAWNNCLDAIEPTCGASQNVCFR